MVKQQQTQPQPSISVINMHIYYRIARVIRKTSHMELLTAKTSLSSSFQLVTDVSTFQITCLLT